MTPTQLRTTGDRLAREQPDTYGPRGKVDRWQTVLAREIGVDASTIRRYLNGSRAIPEPTAKLIRILAGA